MEFKKNQWYEYKYYKNSKESYKYFRVDDILGGEAYITWFTENYIQSKKVYLDINDFKEDYKELPKTLQTLCVGDILTDGEKYIKVLGIINQNCYIMSLISSDRSGYNLDKSFGVYTVQELKDGYFKPYIPKEEEIKEMTVKEVCDKLGYEVKIIKE